MKVNTPVYNLIRQGYSVTAVPRLVAEFNWNRYATPTANNNPPEASVSRHSDIYPVASIMAPQRPKKGHVKATVDNVGLLPSYSPTPPTTRFHIAEPEDIYKYWSSPDKSNATAPYDFPVNSYGTLPTGVNPYVSYDRICNSNKIQIGIENSVHTPDAYTIWTQATVGGAWTQVADQSTATINSKGHINLWWNGTAWTSTKDLTSSKGVAGIQMRVTSMTQPNAWMNVIEIAAQLEKDITDYMMTVTDTFDLGESNVLSPIGKVTSNVATVNLFNALVDDNDYSKGLIFNNTNTNSPFFGLMNENVRFTLDYLYDASQYGGTSAEVVRQFVMYSEQDWSADLQEEVSVSLRDSSKFLQEINCPELFYQIRDKMSIGEIVWRLLDNIGFLDYNIDIGDVATPLPMPYFWTSTDKYVWDVLADLATATQTAIYFDKDGVLQVKTKEAAFNASATPVWTLRGETSGNELEDIYQDGIQNERKDISNSIVLSYRPVDFERSANNNIVSQVAWTPETDPVILRSSDLQQTMSDTQMALMIPAVEAENWQYTGMLQIEGEVMEYDGKQFRYYDDTSDGLAKYVKITSLADYQKYHWKTNANKQYLNGCTGWLYLKERGMWNTYKKAHTLGTSNYTVASFKGASTFPTIYGYYYKKKKIPVASQSNTSTGYEDKASYVRLQSATSWATDQYLCAIAPVGTTGATGGDAPNFYGTKFRIPGTSMKHYRGGLIFNATGTNNSGYHVEIRPTAYTTKNEKEIIVYVKDTAGKKIKLNGKGWRSNIVKDVWYSIDIQFSRGNASDDGGLGNSSHYIWVWINGRLAGKATATGSSRRTNSDRFGMYVSGSSAMDYEYLYAYEKKYIPDLTNQYYPADVSFYDDVVNGYIGNQSLDLFSAQTRTAQRRTPKKPTVEFTQRYDTKFFDEFGPVVHEMRKYDLKFTDKLPGLAPKLSATNTSGAKYIDFRSTGFGAQFYAVNSSHENTNIHGTLDEVNENLAIVMQGLVQQDAAVVTIEDPDSIRVNGKKSMEMASDWLQSKEQAELLGTWIKNHWDSNTDEISVNIFGNTLLELTDVVYVNDPASQRNMVKYFVIAISSEFSQGLGTTLRLRKVRV